MEKIIKLSGRIDSTNAAEVEKRINDEIGSFDGELTLDAGELEYISSAGLRVILRLKKANDTTKVINCSSEVYEIFDMTGFSEMMEVKKAYRKLSVEGCEVIGEGANGIVYRTDPDTIVKVYKNHDSLAEIHNERELARKAFVMGIPTAIPYDVVKVGNLYGSVFELLNAKSYAQLLMDDPSEKNVIKLAHESVDILKIIHSQTVKKDELENKKLYYLDHANKARKFFSDKIGDRLFNLIVEIPDTNNIIHGDFHLKNIMKQNGETLLIDMDTLAIGHPIFEFAGLFLTYIGFSSTNKNVVKNFLGLDYDKSVLFYNETLRYYYKDKSEEYVNDVKRKIAFLGYIRLVSRTSERYDLSIPENKRFLDYCINYINDNVDKISTLVF